MGVVAILTEHCKCDDILVTCIGSLTLLLLIILVGFELTLAVSMSDFCYKSPEESISLLTDGRMINYYMKCEGTNPLSDQFDSSREVISTYQETVRSVRSSSDITCDSTSLSTIMATNNETEVTLDFMEGGSGCSVITPRFQATLHDIICDEGVRGL